MAELRCPMCSKANPDTREVCQYCGARLKPLVLPMTGELNLPDDWIKTPPPAETSGAEPTVQPAKGGTDWLGALRTSSIQDSQQGLESIESSLGGNSVDDWLANLRAQDEAEESAGPGQAPEPPAPAQPPAAPQKRSGGTDWLGSLRPATSDTPSWLTDDSEEPPSLEPPASSSASLLSKSNWLNPPSGGSADETMVRRPPAPATPPPPSSTSSLPSWLTSDEPADTPEPEPPARTQPDAALPDWLSGGSNAAAAEPAVPDWLSPSSPAPQFGTPEPQSGAPAIPDWLSSADSSIEETFVRPPKPAAEPAPALPDWLSGGSPDDTVSVNAPDSGQNSYNNLSGNLSDATIAAPPPSTGDLPDWLAGAQPSTPDWLAAASSSPDDTVSMPGLEAGSGTPDWLNSNDQAPAATPSEPEAAPPTADSLPDWMKTTAEPSRAKPGSSPLPDWLSEPTVKKSSGTLTPKPAKPPTAGLPDWLSETPAKPTAPAKGRPATHELPDWLTGASDINAPITPAEEKPAAPKPITPAKSQAEKPAGRAVEGITDWLAGDSPEIPADLTGAEGPKRPLTTTGWLRSVSPTDSGDNLDWLSNPPPTPSAPPAESKDKAVIGSTDWLASAEGSPTPSSDLPDWLRGSAPATPPPPVSAPTPPPAGSNPSVMGVTDWFASPDSQAPAPAQPPAGGKRPVVGATDWLSSLGPDPLSAPDAPPSAGSPPAGAGGQSRRSRTGWLTGPLKPQTLEQPSQPAPNKAILGATDWLDSLAAAAPASAPGSGKPGSGPLSEPSKAELPDWLATGSSQTGSELPDWVSGDSAADVSAPDASGSQSGKAVVGTTDWLNKIGATPENQDKEEESTSSAFVDTGILNEVRKNDVSDLDWLNSLQPSSPSAAPGPRPLTGPLKAPRQTGPLTPPETKIPRTGELPSWLAALKPTGIDLPETETDETLVSHAPVTDLGLGPATKAPPKAPPPADVPQWLTPEAPAAPAPTPAPAAAPKSTPRPAPSPAPASAPTRKPSRTRSASNTEALPVAPSTPAFSTEETMVSQPKPRTAKPQPALDASAGGPASAVSAPFGNVPPVSVPAFTTPISPEGEDLASANLPAWMRALRPLDARATAREPEPDHEETTGPLAGMRGVLPAESVITMAGRPGASVMGFVLTDAHTKLADRLRRLVEEEGTEDLDVKPHKRTGLNLDIWRFAVAVVLGLLAFVPFFTGVVPPDLQAQLFAPPPVSPAVTTFATAIDHAQSGQVAVVSIDYEPANRGELDPAVSSVLAHLLQRHVRVIVVSSSPIGAALGDQLLHSAALEVSGRQDKKDYLNLGFIPGGAAGLREFAASPSASFSADFNGLPVSAKDWPELASLQKVPLIVVASASADGIQNWIQQVQPQLATNQSLTAISSAAAEPLVAPYASGQPAQLAGLLTGLSGAIQYDTQTQRDPTQAALTSARWFSFGLGLYTAAGILVLGALVSAATLLLSRRPVKAKAGTKARARPVTTRAAAPAPVPEPEPVAPEMPLEPVFDSTATDETMVAAPKPAAKTAKTSKTTKAAPSKKTTATKGKTTTAAGKVRPKSKAPETRIETAAAPSRAKPRMRKV